MSKKRKGKPRLPGYGMLGKQAKKQTAYIHELEKDRGLRPTCVLWTNDKTHLLYCRWDSEFRYTGD